MYKNDHIFQLSSPYDNEYQGESLRTLFVCSAGLLRSATAASVANSVFRHNARSCGTHHYALIPLSVNLVAWAQSIYFVNQDNYSYALDTFCDNPEILRMLEEKSTIWDIEDIYDYNDPKLVRTIIDLLDKEIFT